KGTMLNLSVTKAGGYSIWTPHTCLGGIENEKTCEFGCRADGSLLARAVAQQLPGRGNRGRPLTTVSSPPQPSRGKTAPPPRPRGAAPGAKFAVPAKEAPGDDADPAASSEGFRCPHDFLVGKGSRSARQAPGLANR